jgi:hypothetical protein
MARLIGSAGGRAYWSQHPDEFVPLFGEEVERVVGQIKTIVRFDSGKRRLNDSS